MKTKNLPLIVGISLPLIFIIIISIVIFTPSFFIKPQYNFVYSTEETYYDFSDYQNTYRVENARIVVDPIPTREGVLQTQFSPNLYLYDVKTDSSRQVTFEEVQNYIIDPGPSSPDGYIVAYQYGHDGIFELFGSSSDNNGYFISKGNGKKKLNGLIGDMYYGSRNFNFIGWIK